MQGGWVERSRAGWRGGWREAGRKHHTPVVARRGDARRLLLGELDRIARGRTHNPKLTLAEVFDRFQRQHDTSAANRRRIAHAMQQPLALWGDVLADSVRPEDINRWIAHAPLEPSTKQTYLRVLRQVYGFANENRLAETNPGKRVKTPTVRRSERLCPFQSWDEVERVAEEAGRWAAFVVLAVDTGARPSELARLEHRHVRGARVYLPGTKTRNARRVVTLTERGIAAYQAIPRTAEGGLVFHTNGRAIDLANFRHRVWHIALERAGLQRRGLYQTRHTFAFFSLMAAVPISDLAVEMGHARITLTHETYGHWSDEMGDRAATLRAAWAGSRTDQPPADDEHPLACAPQLPRGPGEPGAREAPISVH